MANNGIKNEYEIVDAINNKKVSELSQNFQFILKKIYGVLDQDAVITAERVANHTKPDIWVEYKGIRKYISIKSGRATEVHCEQLDTFVDFLKENGLTENYTNFFKEYCYGDGTIDGSKGIPFDFGELKTRYKGKSHHFNCEVLSRHYLVENMIDRAIFTGVKGGVPADYIYFGDIYYGEIVSKKQILKHLTIQSWSYMDNPHIGPIQFRMLLRGHPSRPEFEYKRHMVQFWWANLESDLRYIARRYDL